MEALFLSLAPKKAILLNIVIYPCSHPPHPLSLLCQVEIKMKKTDAIRWEKLEGEGQESNIKHFDPSQSTAFRHFTLLPPALLLLSVLSSLRLSLLHLTSSFSLSLSLSLSHLTKINISACVCLFGTRTRALLEPFISLTAKVGRERVRYDSKT